MRATQIARGVILYEKDENDYRQEDMERLAALQAQALDDVSAAQVPNLFPTWKAGVSYAEGFRISDGKGNLYRVVQSHTSQEDWPIAEAPTLYTPLGVTVEDPDAIPEWKQPTGAHDAYNKGDQVRYQGKVYESTMDANTWAPDAFPAGWAEVS